MSTITYLYEETSNSIIDGKKIVNEERIIMGTKGLSIKYFHKEGDSVDKVVIYEKDGKYYLKSGSKDDQKDEEISRDDLIKFLEKDKRMKFAADFVKDFKKKGKQDGGKKKSKKSKRSKKSKKMAW